MKENWKNFLKKTIKFKHIKNKKNRGFQHKGHKGFELKMRGKIILLLLS